MQMSTLVLGPQKFCRLFRRLRLGHVQGKINEWLADHHTHPCWLARIGTVWRQPHSDCHSGGPFNTGPAPLGKYDLFQVPPHNVDPKDDGFSLFLSFLVAIPPPLLPRSPGRYDFIKRTSRY
jgi:hypothetical protein